MKLQTKELKKTIINHVPAFITCDTLYDCTICQTICVNRATEGEILYPEENANKNQNKQSSLEQKKQFSNVAVYPNPTDNNLNVKLLNKSEIQQTVQIDLIDFSGKTIGSVKQKLKFGENIISCVQ